jgi:CVNH domain
VKLAAIGVGIIIVVTSATVSFAQQPPGSYKQSCSNIRFDGRKLSAVCADGIGRRVPTSLLVDRCVGGISNQNGQLYCEAGGPPRAYENRYEDDDDFDRRPRHREYSGRDYDFPGQPPRGDNFSRGGVPGGSWHGSCKNAQMRGPILIALCANVRGEFQQTTADLRSCRSFANRNGNLVCE